MSNPLPQLFADLVALLEQFEVPSVAQAASLSADDGRLDEFLRSDELWGGAGSIADQAGLNTKDAVGRRAMENALIALGKEQIRQGIVNPRTLSWVEIFVEWRERGI